MNTTATMDAQDLGAPITVEQSLLDRAKANDTQAIVSMFQQFLSPDEDIYFAEYCGVQGFWGLGTHCFACLTNRRLAALQVGIFGRLIYQDGYLEYTNSGVIFQPSKLMFYITVVLAALVALGVTLTGLGVAGEVAQGFGGIGGMLLAIIVTALFLGLAALAFVVMVKGYYRFNKSGLVWWIREGISVYVFLNRSRLTRANHLYRLCTQVRDERLKVVGQP